MLKISSFIFHHIDMEVIVLAPLCEVGRCVVVCSDGDVVIEESQGCSVRVYVVCCDG